MRTDNLLRIDAMSVLIKELYKLKSQNNKNLSFEGN